MTCKLSLAQLGSWTVQWFIFYSSHFFLFLFPFMKPGCFYDKKAVHYCVSPPWFWRPPHISAFSLLPTHLNQLIFSLTLSWSRGVDAGKALNWAAEQWASETRAEKHWSITHWTDIGLVLVNKYFINESLVFHLIVLSDSILHSILIFK